MHVLLLWYIHPKLAPGSVNSKVRIEYRSRPLCYLQKYKMYSILNNFTGWCISFFSIMPLYLSVLISIHMYQSIMDPMYRMKKETVFKRSIAGANITVLIYNRRCSEMKRRLTSIILWSFSFVDVGSYCWIAQPPTGTQHTTGFSMRLALRYCQALAVCLFNLWLYVKLYKYISQLDKELQTNNSQTTSNKSSRSKKTIRKFIYYPCK